MRQSTRSKATKKFVAVGSLQPFAGGIEYQTRIEYDIRRAPRIWIESPRLERRSDEEPIPHMYEQERVCAFMPQIDWNREMFIADYVPGRVVQWLYFYEIWRATGEWFGGGIHPVVPEKTRRLATPIDTEAPLE